MEMKQSQLLHYPIMHREIVEAFALTDRDIFIDCTLGMGGHSLHILDSFDKTNVVGVDIDMESLKKAKINLSEFKDRVTYHNIDYMNIFQSISHLKKKISGILVDPGISMYQLKEETRGFSHNINSPLDMRKDRTSEKYVETAYDVVNSYSERQLSAIFSDYGDIKKAPVLSKKIIETRLFKKIDTTFKLKEIVEKIMGFPKRGRSHPAAKVFQALRIYVNRELDGLGEFINKIPDYLKSGGVIAFLTFHSIEDRIVKRTLKKLSDSSVISLVKPYPMTPTDREIEENSASAPAKLRVAKVL